MLSPTTVSAEDRLAVLDIHARCAHAIDRGDGAGWAGCFTADGVLRTTRPLELRGRAALEDFAREWHGGSGDPRRHVTWHHLVEDDGESLTGTCYAALLRTAPEGVVVEFTSVYRDRFARSGAGLLISERLVELDRPTPPQLDGR